MLNYNLIVVYDGHGHTLFCRRAEDPYKGLLNFPGGKVESGEDEFDAAYRELFEETGISSDQIILHKIMDLQLWVQNCFISVFSGQLSRTGHITLVPEKNELFWWKTEKCMPSDYLQNTFAGDGSIPFIINQLSTFGFGFDTTRNGMCGLSKLENNRFLWHKPFALDIKNDKGGKNNG